MGGLSAGGSIACLILVPAFQWLYILGISVMGFCALFGFAGICLPKHVLVEQGDILVLYNGFRNLRRQEIKIAELLSAEFDASSDKKSTNGNIVLTVREGAATKNILVIGIKNRQEVVDKLRILINSGSDR